MRRQVIGFVSRDSESSPSQQPGAEKVVVQVFDSTVEFLQGGKQGEYYKVTDNQGHMFVVDLKGKVSAVGSDTKLHSVLPITKDRVNDLVRRAKELRKNKKAA